jgi:adenosylhomocysteinase
MILDDGGDATLYILLGARAEGETDLIEVPKSEEEAVIKADQETHGRKPRLVREGAT